jgi:heme-binding protein
MKPTTGALRRALYGVFAATLVGGAAGAAMTVPSAPSATAADDPCAASSIARTIGTVATNTGNYLDSHPQTNNALTVAAQQQGPQALTGVKSYFDANPQAGKDIQGLQQPLQDLAGKCKLPISMPQVLQMMQAAQSGQLPGAAAALGAAGSPAAAAPAGTPSAGTAPAATAPPATGPRPGPVASPVASVATPTTTAAVVPHGAAER